MLVRMVLESLRPVPFLDIGKYHARPSARVQAKNRVIIGFFPEMRQSRRVHPRGLSLAQQQKVYVRRTVHKESWQKIAPQIKNLQGKTPGWPVCRDAFKRMVEDRRDAGYANCGRRAR